MLFKSKRKIEILLSQIEEYKTELENLKEVNETLVQENEKYNEVVNENNQLKKIIDELTTLLTDLTEFNINHFDFPNENMRKSVENIYIKTSFYNELKRHFIT